MAWWSSKKESPAQGEGKARSAAPSGPPAAAPSAPDGAPEAAPRQGWLARLTAGIQKTRAAFTGQIKGLFARTTGPSEDFFEELEAILLSADCGVEVTGEILRTLRERYAREPGLSSEAALAWIRELVGAKVARNQAAMNLDAADLAVILVVGVNGVGKTTTIAKLASIFKAYGRKLLLVAGDTWRAGAIEQLSQWGQRLGIEVSQSAAGADPSAIIYDALSAARARGHDMVIIDTAGRLHTQANLMEELRKVRRVIGKVIPDAPHETFLVLDATLGQNAIAQATMFDQTMGITGLVLTKLDGTAKGGIVVCISEKLKVPIRFVGVGEGIDDLRPFKPEEFVEALFA